MISKIIAFLTKLVSDPDDQMRVETGRFKIRYYRSYSFHPKGSCRQSAVDKIIEDTTTSSTYYWHEVNGHGSMVLMKRMSQPSSGFKE